MSPQYWNIIVAMSGFRIGEPINVSITHSKRTYSEMLIFCLPEWRRVEFFFFLKSEMKMRFFLYYLLDAIHTGLHEFPQQGPQQGHKPS